MQFEQYQKLALKTESVPASLHINQYALLSVLDIAIAATKIADLAKRKLYYGKDFPQEQLVGELKGLFASVRSFKDLAAADSNGAINNPEGPHGELLADEFRGISLDKLNIRLLHGALGLFTESGEQLEALRVQFLGKGLDKVNFAEEVGDTNWYDAVLKDELAKLAAADGKSINDATIRLSNITKLQGNAKLKGRYAEGDFNVIDALNRNLARERALLESSDDSAAVADTKVA